ncbi:DUF2007 domain-containing protein [bacterium]|nr:DUF2007 domain-containing protein [bacterium]
MFCPKCKAEYNPGIVTCADCHIPLVHELPVPVHELKHDFVFLVETMNLSDIALIESVLRGSGIQYRIMGENFNLYRPLVEPVQFFVQDDRLEDAQTLLSEMNLKYSGLSISGSDS